MTTTHNKPTHGSLEWLNLRHRDEHGRVRFGASEAPILMDVSPYKTLADLAVEKWTEPTVNEPSPAMMRGNILEPALLKYAEELLTTTVTTPDTMFSNGRLIATLDGLAFPGDDCVIVECKTTTAYSSDDELPQDYYWQVIAQFACVPEATEALVVVLDRHMRLGSWRVMRDEAAIAVLMAQADITGEAFDKREMPENENLTEKAIKTLYPNPVGSVEIGYNGIVLIDEYRSAQRAAKFAAEQEQAFRDQLVSLLGNAEAGTVDGQIVVTFKTRSTGSRWDTKRLEQDHPELAADYKKQAGSTRVLKVIGE